VQRGHFLEQPSGWTFGGERKCTILLENIDKKESLRRDKAVEEHKCYLICEINIFWKKHKIIEQKTPSTLNAIFMKVAEYKINI